MAHRSSVYAVTKHCPAYEVIGTPMILPNECMYQTRHSELFPTSSDFAFNTLRALQIAQHFVSDGLEVEKTRQKTYYDYCSYGLSYNEGEQVLVFFPILKKG